MSDGWAYIARTPVRHKEYPAGTVLCVTVDDPNRTKESAKAVGQWMRQGMTIERVPIEWVREHFLTTEIYRAVSP